MKLKIIEAYVDEDYIEVSFWSYMKFHIFGVLTFNALLIGSLMVLGMLLDLVV